VLAALVHGSPLEYAGILLAAAATWAGVPGPGEAALIAGGVLAARGHLDISLVVTSAFIGATVGGIVGWVAGMKVGRTVAGGPGPLRRARIRILELGERFYERYGVLAVFFTPAWLAGIHRMAAVPYNIANAASAIAWALLVGVGAYLIGPSIADVVHDIGFAGVLTIVVVGVIGAILERRRRRLRAGSRSGR
jgi:membrane-associated protein